ncbi:MAG TPA: NAD(P)-dependent alcohol dehydrogenase [Devosiaceae bacterium]|jgi:NADPH:quinone reductase-like Zn-dependent oxidoreductase|nr:NAD(P)-dependent alcohol dehydrogenase [Devosiaceae bacterium]
MKAAVYTNYGPPGVVTLAEVETPTPGDHDVLVRIRATTVSSADWRARSLSLPPGFGFLGRLMFGLFGPRKKILGTELAGTVEAVGKGVTRFRPGDDVFAFTGAGFGCHAEYRVLPEDGRIVRKPANLSFEEAAALSFGGTTALCYLRDKGGVRAGEKVLVVGASGAVGTAAVQIARHFGAKVAGVCSTGNVELVRSLGAEMVIDYTREDFAGTGETWDIILDTTGTAPFARSGKALEPGGRLLVVLGSATQLLGLERPPRGSDKRIVAGVAPERLEDLEYLARLAEAGEYRPVIDRSFPLEHAAEAHAYVDTGRKRGNVVLTVAAPAPAA